MESGNPAKWEDDRTSKGAEDGASVRNSISTSSSGSTEIEDSSKTTAMVLAKEEKTEEEYVESGKQDSENRAGIESESAMEGSCVLQSPPTLELEDWIRDEPICCMPLADQNSIHESNTLMIPSELDMDGSCNVSSRSQETGKEMLQNMMNFSNSGLGRDSAHLARSSSISRGMFPDLKKIIVKKPILDKAVERLGGGRKGALMLWKVIQVWLSHQKKSDVADLEALGTPCYRPEQWISPDVMGGSENCFDSFGNQGTIQPGLDGVHFPDAGYVGVSQNCIDGQSIHPAEQSNSYQAYQQASMAAYQEEAGGNPSGYSGFAAEYNNLNPQMRCRHQMIPVHHQQDMENGQQILQNAAMAGLAPMDAINMGSWNPAATTRAARRSRMARQRRMAQHHHARLAASHNISMPMSWSPYMSYAAIPEQQGHQGPLTYPREAKVRNSEKQLKFLFQKELKPSDVGNLGRVVLPKKEAEMHLPSLSAREGMALPMEDMTTGHVWHFKYRFWPNNKSRMYLLENTGEFVRSHHLQEGDLMRIYKDPRTSKYVINGTKSGKVEVASAAACVKSMKTRVTKEEESMSGLTSTSSGTDSGNADSLRDNACTINTAMLGSLHSSNEGNITNVMHEFSNDSRFDPSSLPQLERFPSFEIGDMMIDEIFGFVDAPEAETTSRKSDVAVEN